MREVYLRYQPVQSSWQAELQHQHLIPPSSEAHWELGGEGGREGERGKERKRRERGVGRTS
ncbi:MAG: hypothetical protein MJE68_17490 [Proteobacteria bacterium]|nr:hypothetical protein [Pseudomonadota bacterium]